ncbi:VOC family protein [Pedobacter africanus]|uniref:Glyoxalase superfamily enzyme, possibly 3-demethylubiquinone-9 3-methyltransferase n=1 Tax=Pedobacter africanus TaxID=151894 RepID=A0A1W1Z863_9SPHI|nr:VOC family protein [Pedobacter africanus]SMC44640.1 Glyoxalase superfamily enzyme, possibly 3-demethylubiquinone-9 3-methyltransferase [Pedobacter africanus]
MKQQITTFLTFQENNSEQAMNFYVGLFENSKIIDIQRYDKAGPGKEGSVMKATFELNGKQFICSDSFVKHQWNFTPAISNWVECENDKQLETLFKKLSAGGSVMMPLDNYGFSKKFAWVADQFGISWQLNFQ